MNPREAEKEKIGLRFPLKVIFLFWDCFFPPFLISQKRMFFLPNIFRFFHFCFEELGWEFHSPKHTSTLELVHVSEVVVVRRVNWPIAWINDGDDFSLRSKNFFIFLLHHLRFRFFSSFFVFLIVFPSFPPLILHSSASEMRKKSKPAHCLDQ